MALLSSGRAPLRAALSGSVEAGQGAGSPIPANTVAPVASGTVIVAQTLSTTDGTWTNSPTSFAYQWTRDGVAISAATNNTYTVVLADVGHGIACIVTATNAAGSASATSNTLGAVSTAGELVGTGFMGMFVPFTKAA